MAVARGQRQHRAHGELALVHRAGIDHGAQHVDGALVHVAGDLRQVGGGQAVVLHDLQQRVGGRVRVAAGGMPFERGLGRGPARADAVREARGVGVRGHACRQALRPGEDVLRARESVLGQVGRHQARSGRMRRVQLLAVGARAQELPQPCRLRAGRAEGVLHLRGREAQQPAHGGSSGQGAGRGRGVEDAVVAAAQEFAHADADLVAGHAGGHELGAAGADALGDGQRGREDHGRGVKDRAVVHVVLLGHMRGRGIGQGRHHGRGGVGTAQDLARPLRRSLGQRKARDALHGARALACEHGAEPVHPEVFGALLNGGGNVVPAQRGSELGQRMDAHLGVVFHGLGLRRILGHAPWFQGAVFPGVGHSALMRSALQPSSARMAALCSPTAGTASMR